MEVATWGLTVVSLIGACLNAFHKKSGFVVWAVGNTGWIGAHAIRGMWPETLLFAAYLVLSLVGLFMWRD